MNPNTQFRHYIIGGTRALRPAFLVAQEVVLGDGATAVALHTQAAEGEPLRELHLADTPLGVCCTADRRVVVLMAPFEGCAPSPWCVGMSTHGAPCTLR
eukprot:NODE_3275_length_410_cov_336.983380_g2746_i0.p1 GENE.NODE_3275_length_410_cov_336.983380_g2746_i0~~NODE_3275_length_410_cov_336.983380_g2746_i0.p1  ORF type:complete len:99 (+),score=10.86 NODE_3275_length_410_cov_336.983380_g2746_i0:98-394(+)